MMKKGMDEDSKLNLIILTNAVISLKQKRYNFNKAVTKELISINDYRVDKYKYELGSNIVNVVLTEENVLLLVDKDDNTIGIAVDVDDISNLSYEELEVLGKRFNIKNYYDLPLNELKTEINKHITKKSNLSISEKLNKSKRRIEKELEFQPTKPIEV